MGFVRPGEGDEMDIVVNANSPSENPLEVGDPEHPSSQVLKGRMRIAGGRYMQIALPIGACIDQYNPEADSPLEPSVWEGCASVDRNEGSLVVGPGSGSGMGLFTR